MFQIEAMAYIPIIQAALEYMPHGFLPRINSMSDYLQKKNNNAQQRELRLELTPKKHRIVNMTAL